MYGTIVSYAWDFGDGAESSGPVVGHSFTAPGSHVVTWTVTNSFNVSGNASRTVTVSDIPEIELANYPTDRGSRFRCKDLVADGGRASWRGVDRNSSLRGPRPRFLLTNILVDTGSDSSS